LAVKLFTGTDVAPAATEADAVTVWLVELLVVVGSEMIIESPLVTGPGSALTEMLV
jgi:hypothetical protein